MKSRIMVLLCAFLAGILLSGNAVSQEDENAEEGSDHYPVTIKDPRLF